jgi:hypothetical protein
VILPVCPAAFTKRNHQAFLSSGWKLEVEALPSNTIFKKPRRLSISSGTSTLGSLQQRLKQADMIYQRETRLSFLLSCVAFLCATQDAGAFSAEVRQGTIGHLSSFNADVLESRREIAAFGKRSRDQSTTIFSPMRAGDYNPSHARRSTRRSSSRSGSNELTSSLISELAKVALQLRLHSHAGVACDVTADPARFLSTGSIGPVTVKGKGWGSSLGLTCRAIEATVETCYLDFGRVMKDRKLKLTTPAKGKAMIAMTGNDFGNFVKHPFFMEQVPKTLDDHPFDIMKDNVVVDSTTGSVFFQGTVKDVTYECKLSRGDQKTGAQVHVRALESNQDGESETIANDLTIKLTAFFTNLVFELDGTFLQFQDMMITKPRSDKEPNLLLSLSITVHKFPSPGVNF